MANYGIRTEGGNTRVINGSTHESIFSFNSGVYFNEDFLGKVFNVTHTWTAIDVSSAGDSTPVLVADGLNGLITLPIDSTSEAQETGLTWGDQQTFCPARGLVFEAGFAMATLPTSGTKFVIGLASAKNATADSVTTNLWFVMDGSGLVACESDDGTTDNDDKTSGITLVAAAQHIFRIDCSNTSDVRFYIDGASVATSTTFTLAAATPATLALQPYVHGAKASGTSVGVMTLDYIRCFQNRV